MMAIQGDGHVVAVDLAVAVHINTDDGLVQRVVEGGDDVAFHLVQKAIGFEMRSAEQLARELELIQPAFEGA